MDSAQINTLCSSNVILRSFYLGVIRWENLKNTEIRFENIGEFIWINFLNSHWIVIQKMSDKKLAPFD